MFIVRYFHKIAWHPGQQHQFDYLKAQPVVRINDNGMAAKKRKTHKLTSGSGHLFHHFR